LGLNQGIREVQLAVARGDEQPLNVKISLPEANVTDGTFMELGATFCLEILGCVRHVSPPLDRGRGV
jgi:hypothetical protein